MTRQEIISTVLDLLQEPVGTEGAMSVISMDRLVTTACDLISRSTDCYYTTATGDIVAEQAEYTQSQLKTIKAVSVTDASAVRHTLTSRTIQWMDENCPTWRDQTSANYPTTWIPLGLNNYVLYPAPNYSRTGGVVLEGYGVPGSSWSAKSADCPLPETAHMCVVYQAAKLRIIQRPSQENMLRRSMIDEEFKAEKGKLEREVRTISHATLQPSYIGNGGNFNINTDGNPLDL